MVSQTLEAVKNQADRENLGYQKGLEVLFKDPLDFAGKGVKESRSTSGPSTLGPTNGLEGAYTRGVISPAWLLPDQLLGDTLYIIVTVLALLGLVVAPRSIYGLKSFVAIWLVYNMALAFAFFAVTRFRLPVYYLFFPFAAYTPGPFPRSSRVAKAAFQTARPPE